jgi:hypothetical protein
MGRICRMLALLALSWPCHAMNVSALQDLLNIPYVNDGVQDVQGRWTTFTHPETILPTPGLNCSGFTIACARRLLGFSGTVDEATRDRLNDSGQDAKLGRDWDFAWDLIMNLSEGHKRRALLPEGEARIQGTNGLTLRGFPMEDREAWRQVLPRLQARCVYLCSISRSTKGHVQHYHAVLLLRDSLGSVWLYQTLPLGRSHRLNLTSDAGFDRMQEMFRGNKRILILEVDGDTISKP